MNIKGQFSKEGSIMLRLKNYSLAYARLRVSYLSCLALLTLSAMLALAGAATVKAQTPTPTPLPPAPCSPNLDALENTHGIVGTPTEIEFVIGGAQDLLYWDFGDG